MEEEIIKKYIECFFAMDKAMERGNYRENNRLAKAMQGYYEELKKMGPESVLNLKPYLNHENDVLKCRVAKDLLQYDENAAMETLEWLAKHSLDAGMSAKYILRDWREGN